jgi:hypothetical protein
MAFVRQSHKRDRQPRLIELPAVGTHAETADVDDMDHAGKQATGSPRKKVGPTTVRSCR